jgi:23S rRNA pseudouridine2605 synthase
MNMTADRLQKILAQAGYGSRRSCEQFIQDGRVRVNGEVARLGSKADPRSDRIEIDGVALPAPEKLVYIALHKPRYVISAVSTPDRRKTVTDLVDIEERVYPVGRLDVDSEGLILLTNDGELANRLTHPRYGHEKEYHVFVNRRPDAAQLEAWRRGVVLEDGYRTAPARVYVKSSAGKGTWLKIILSEGRKRQIRETGSQIGLNVSRILRVRIGSLELGNLKSGEWRYLTSGEIKALQKPASAPRKNRKQPARTPARGKARPGKKP